MRNLRPYNGECFNVHKEAIKNKQSEELKKVLNLAEEQILNQYNSYEEYFNKNKLEILNHDERLTEHKDALLSLYDYQSAIIRSVRRELEISQLTTIRHTCQYCTLTSVESLDHIIPKSEFPEFVVNPKNLFPCCSRCNSLKSSAWLEDGKRKYLNLFLDQLPREQYLFVNILKGIDDEIDFHFYLNNSSNIDDELYDLVLSHYSNLQLLDRMKMKAVTSLTELKNSIQVRLENLPIDSIIEEVKETATRNKQAYGDNYWKSILEISLVESPLFLELITQGTGNEEIEIPEI